MKHLSGLDAAFLHLETPETPMHVGALHLLDVSHVKGEVYDAVKHHIQSRMHLAPMFTRKLALMPFDLANPAWIYDGDIDIDYHIRRIVLPKPGTLEQLETYAGRLHSSLLDRSRPLWEFYVIEGMRDGRVGFYTKLHHAALDGQGAVALGNAILDLTPEGRKIEKPHASHHDEPYQPAVDELVKSSIANLFGQIKSMAKNTPAVAKALLAAAVPKRGEDGQRVSLLPRGLLMGPRTPLNVAVTNQRAFATLSLPLAEVKAIGKSVDGTLNDAVMALCAGALRTYLQERGALPKKPLVAAVPVSLREKGDTSTNNQASMMLASLATHIADPLKRLLAIKESMASAKAMTGNFKSVIPTDFPSLGVPWLMSGVASLYGRSRIANRFTPLANVVISNVPGAPVPLYMGGARLLSFYPLSIVVHGVALNITVQSYDGKMDVGFIACRRAMPDVRDLAHNVQAAFDELQQIIAKRMHAVTAAAQKSAGKTKAAPGKRSATSAATNGAARKTSARRIKAQSSGKAPLKRARKVVEKST
jgi:diacylglycerol O-acyltransferase / wax synthase